MRKITLSIITLFAINSFAQSNANCGGAIALSPGVEATGSANSGSYSGVNASCGPSTNDFWYSFIAPVSGEVTINSSEFYAVFTDCTGASEVFCGNGNNLIQSLTNGATYYVQVRPFPVACKGFACGDFTITASGNVLSNIELINNQFKVYPNPVNGVLNISTEKELKSIQIYNILGKQLISIVPNNLETILDFSAFKSGHYILKLNSESASKIIKVFKK